MTTSIETYIQQNDLKSAIEECGQSGYDHLGYLLSLSTVENVKTRELGVKIGLIKNEEKVENKCDTDITIKILCNWTSSREQSLVCNKMSKGNFRWNRFRLIWDDNEEPDFYVVINAPPKNITIDKSKTVVFRMEPYMDLNPIWGEWSTPDRKEFVKVCYHEDEYNNNEWHISKTYTELLNNTIDKTAELDNVLSTVLSSKYTDIGHIKRIDFIKYIDSKKEEGDPLVHVYGDNKFNYKNYKGSLPYHSKDNALLPYKYTFNAENNSITNYYTEKLIDGILSECLTFYWGCPNIRELIDPRAYVELSLSNFENDYNTIKRAISEDWWSQRIDIIRSEKKRILNSLQFFPRLEKIITDYKEREEEKTEN